MASGTGYDELDPRLEPPGLGWRAALSRRPLPVIGVLAAVLIVAASYREATPPPLVPTASSPPAATTAAPPAPAATPVPSDAATTLTPNPTPAPRRPIIAAAPSETLAPADEHWAFASARSLLADAGPSIIGSPTGLIVSERAAAKIDRAAELARRGALFASRSELLETLRMIAEAKDQRSGKPRRADALASGLRALAEADDFVARRPEARASESLRTLISAHRTPVGKAIGATELVPTRLADLYFRYAQIQLGAAVANEPTGSMALHSLGKLYSQLGRFEPERHPQAPQCAFACQQAALLARGDNYLASHELGVLMAESGHFGEAEHVLAAVASQQPNPTVYRNLAHVQEKLGRIDVASINQRQATQLATASPGGSAYGVAWMAPQDFARTGGSDQRATAPSGAVYQAAAPRPSQPQQAVRPTPIFFR